MSYKNPPDFLENVGDYGTDAYQIFLHEEKLIVYLYQDGEWILEVIGEISLKHDIVKQEWIEKEFIKVLDSITINKN